MSTTKLMEKISMLPPALQQQIFDFVDFVSKKNQVMKKKSAQSGLQFTWEGGLKNIKNISAVELQHQASAYRLNNVVSH